MNPDSLWEAKFFFTEIKKIARVLPRVTTVVCPPAVYLEALTGSYNQNRITLGAQDVSTEERGSFTGEVSAAMFQKIGAKYVIVGHSERRGRGETDSEVQKKVLACLRHNLAPILCIGEKQRDADGTHLAFIKNELKEDLAKVTYKELQKIVIAYEPIWAIGKKDTEAMSPPQIEEMLIFIRKELTDLYRGASMKNVRILYGGSVSVRNAESMLENSSIDGFLIGNQSLKPDGFCQILKYAHASR